MGWVDSEKKVEEEEEEEEEGGCDAAQKQVTSGEGVLVRVQESSMSGGGTAVLLGGGLALQQVRQVPAYKQTSYRANVCSLHVPCCNLDVAVISLQVRALYKSPSLVFWFDVSCA